ncbi:hypothetical protein F5B22DRAFT_509167 [Xylaria bambusicola]|uniref:uncharacterized protein n=1 Tax=Xylaria bambusicola TaxID=326684 RepID=UPI0020074A73|nr:uncharacterized protein F5B22DRAFT_509167 [Xylaria bambusicola]KAI0521896.1 hypothetical protein F5B22DRAFT_509167 [Xylaria bambusicola]
MGSHYILYITCGAQEYCTSTLLVLVLLMLLFIVTASNCILPYTNTLTYVQTSIVRRGQPCCPSSNLLLRYINSNILQDLSYTTCVLICVLNCGYESTNKATKMGSRNILSYSHRLAIPEISYP